MRNGDTVRPGRGRSASCSVSISTTEACARAALGSHWQTATAQQRQEYVEPLRELRHHRLFHTSLPRSVGKLHGTGSQPDRGLRASISRDRINGAVPIRFDWQLKPTNAGYKVTNLIVIGINMAIIQRSDLVSVIQRNDGHVQALLAALREKNASNGIRRY